MSGLSDHERAALAQIERDLAARDTRLARRLARPGWLARWRWGTHRAWLHALLAVALLSLIPLAVALFG